MPIISAEEYARRMKTSGPPEVKPGNTASDGDWEAWLHSPISQEEWLNDRVDHIQCKKGELLKFQEKGLFAAWRLGVKDALEQTLSELPTT